MGLAQLPAMDEKGDDEARLQGDHREASKNGTPVALDDRRGAVSDDGAGRKPLGIEVPVFEGPPVHVVFGWQGDDPNGLDAFLFEEPDRHLGRARALGLELRHVAADHATSNAGGVHAVDRRCGSLGDALGEDVRLVLVSGAVDPDREVEDR